MNDEAQVLRRLYEAIDAPGAMSAFDTLAPLPETERRRFLRPHWERAVLTENEIQLRDNASAALDFFALLAV